jgi:hypothetical protein
VQQFVIKRLFDSFIELEQAIETATGLLNKKANPPQHILNRLDNYREILEKQKNLATALCGYAAIGSWDQVSRHIKIINGLSSMIRDDAREVISSLHIPARIEQNVVELS